MHPEQLGSAVVYQILQALSVLPSSLLWMLPSYSNRPSSQNPDSVYSLLYMLALSWCATNPSVSSVFIFSFHSFVASVPDFFLFLGSGDIGCGLSTLSDIRLLAVWVYNMGRISRSATHHRSSVLTENGLLLP